MKNNKLTEIVKTLGRKFRYRLDPKLPLDYWSVMKEKNSVMQGDCDDFTITCFWHLSGENLWRFLWNTLVTHRYEIYRVKSSNGAHIVGCFENQWFDNWTLDTHPKKQFFDVTGHRLEFRYYAPVIAVYLLLGRLYNKGR